ncbi:MAG: amidohydrolase family protein [Deltaproteobacteria bacterium]|nr:amidohydrolase family protein [Deltaproteobacteria bacterium]
MAIMLKGGSVVAFDPPEVEARDVVLRGAHDGVVDVSGCLVLPGLGLAHTHLYSALARGMPGPVGPTRSFREILERVWWRLDVALDAESLAASAMVALCDAALAGATCVFDHHESPGFIDGSLDVIAEAAERVGVRIVVCYGATDRHGHRDAIRGLDECVRMIERVRAAPRGRLGTMLGLHACFTVTDETLSMAADLARGHDLGLHVHAAEDACDAGAIERLGRFGLLGPRTLLAHAVHATSSEKQLVRASGAFVAHNPRSNMQNSVGQARLADLAGSVALGTDGMDGDLFAEARAAHLGGRVALGPEGGVDAVGMLAAGARLAEAHLGPVGSDAVVVEYDPPTPLDRTNVAGHLLFGITAAHVRDVFVDGAPVVRDRRLVRVDAAEIAARGREQALALWRRMS